MTDAELAAIRARARGVEPVLLAEIDRLRALLVPIKCPYCNTPLDSEGHSRRFDLGPVEVFTCPSVPEGQMYAFSPEYEAEVERRSRAMVDGQRHMFGR